MCNQIIFSVENQWEVWRGRSWRLSTAVNTALWFPALFWWEQNEKKTQLLVNELASPLAPPLFRAPGADKVARWVDFRGERRVRPTVLVVSDEEAQLESLQVSPRHLWPSRFQWRELKKRDGEETLKSWLFPQRRFRNPEISLYKSVCPHGGRQKRKYCKHILWTAGCELTLWAHCKKMQYQISIEFKDAHSHQPRFIFWESPVLKVWL